MKSHVTIWWKIVILFSASFLAFHLQRVIKTDPLQMKQILSFCVVFFPPVVTVGLFVHLKQQVLRGVGERPVHLFNWRSQWWQISGEGTVWLSLTLPAISGKATCQPGFVPGGWIRPLRSHAGSHLNFFAFDRAFDLCVCAERFNLFIDEMGLLIPASLIRDPLGLCGFC